MRACGAVPDIARGAHDLVAASLPVADSLPATPKPCEGWCESSERPTGTLLQGYEACAPPRGRRLQQSKEGSAVSRRALMLGR